MSASDSMVDWTDASGRSDTSRQAVERLSSERARGLAEAEAVAAEDLRVLRVWRMVVSGLSLDLN